MLKMQGAIFEFLIWFIVVIVLFWIINNYVMLKRFASIIIASLIGSIILFMIYHDIFAEIVLTITFIIIAFYGLSCAMRAFRNETSESTNIVDALKRIDEHLAKTESKDKNV